MVLFFVLLLASAMASFLRRVAVDAAIAVNRDRAQQAESLARGGVRLAEAILLEDLRTKGARRADPTAATTCGRAPVMSISIDDPDVDLHVRIEDAAARINLNGFLVQGRRRREGTPLSPTASHRRHRDHAGPPRRAALRPVELSANLVDWIDSDEVSANGALRRRALPAPRSAPSRAEPAAALGR